MIEFEDDMGTLSYVTKIHTERVAQLSGCVESVHGEAPILDRLKIVSG